MFNWDIVTYSFLDFSKVDFHSSEVGFIKISRLRILLARRCGCLVEENILILDLKSVFGIFNLSRIMSKADLAPESEFSFMFIPI